MNPFSNDRVPADLSHSPHSEAHTQEARLEMIIVGDSFQELAKLENGSVQTCVTSPPYWGLRDYGHEGQLGLEKTPEQYVGNLRLIFEQVRRVLKPDGTLWLNLGDSYSSGNSGLTMRPKNLLGIPWRVAFALQADGWYLRQDIIWAKPNPMPESVRDRCTKAHEYIFLLAKSEKYFFDIGAIKEPSVEWAKGRSRPRNKPNGTSAEDLKRFKLPSECQITPFRQKRSVWTVTTKSFKGAHFATFPPGLIEPCILAGSRPGDTVLDPFFGAGTTGLVAKKHGRNYIGIEINPEYAALAQGRIELSEATA